MKTRFRADELGSLVWLLSLTWDGQVYRFSSRPIDLLDEDGLPISFLGGLDLSSWDGDLEFLSTSPGEQSVSAEVDFPIDVADRISSGHPLDTATGEFSVIEEEDSDYADRLVLLTGWVDTPEYGAYGEPVRFSLVAENRTSSTSIPPSTWRLTEETWPSATYSYADDDPGAWYPIVAGQPGYIDGVHVGRGSPCLVLHRDTGSGEAQTLLVAGHPVDATTVAIIDSDGATTGALSISRRVDGLGQEVSVVDISGSGGTIDLTLGEFYCAWNTGLAMSGVDTVGDWLAWLLRQSPAGYDAIRTKVAVSRLHYRVDTYINDSASILDVIESILTTLPISVCSGPEGLFPVVWRLDASEKDAVAKLLVGAGLVRDGLWAYDRSRSDIVTEVRASYRIAVSGNSTSFVLSAQDNADGNSIYSEVAQNRYGLQSEDLSIPWTWRDGPAVAAAYLRARCSSLRRAYYIGSFREYGNLSPGDVVILEDNEMSYDGLALVSSMGISDGEIRIGLLILDDSAQIPD